LQDLTPKLSYTDSSPFHRLKVKVKQEIVTLGVAGIDPAQQTGTHVSPQAWDALLSDPDLLVIDTRNQYEYELGTFAGAISPQTQHFREFPQFVQENLDPAQHPKIALFCTGGIRCEKASAYLLQQGFNEVYQLEGGILSYLETHQSQKSLWAGECFVFDGRVAVDQQLAVGQHILCYACRRPLSAQDCQSEHYEPGISCSHCFASLTASRRASFTERRRQMVLAQQRHQKHVGAVMPNTLPDGMFSPKSEVYPSVRGVKLEHL
jgi:UPF0176 protein